MKPVLKKIATVLGLALSTLIVVGGLMYLAGLRVVLDGGGTPTLRFTRSAADQADAIARHRLRHVQDRPVGPLYPYGSQPSAERLPAVQPDPRGLAHLRVTFSEAFYVGPGRADLLEGIATTGSIAAAGKAMGMSYKRAWSLVQALNGGFGVVLVDSSRGGAHQGSGSRGWLRPLAALRRSRR